jgi:hypothetical protein
MAPSCHLQPPRFLAADAPNPRLSLCPMSVNPVQCNKGECLRCRGAPTLLILPHLVPASRSAVPPRRPPRSPVPDSQRNDDEQRRRRDVRFQPDFFHRPHPSSIAITGHCPSNSLTPASGPLSGRRLSFGHWLCSGRTHVLERLLLPRQAPAAAACSVVSWDRQGEKHQ